MDNVLNIITINIKDIKQYEQNSKQHPRWHIDQIKKSIQEFGYNDLIAIDENDTIIEGNGRYTALIELGYENIEVIQLKHLSEKQKKAYILVHNKITMNTDFDYELLQNELKNILDNESLKDYGFNIDDFVDDFNDLENKVNLTKKLTYYICPCCKHKELKSKFKEVLDG